MLGASTQRVIVRWLHVILAIPIIGYIYSPFENLADYAPTVRFVAFPVILVTGIWMWKGHWVRRFVTKKPQEA